MLTSGVSDSVASSRVPRKRVMGEAAMLVEESHHCFHDGYGWDREQGFPRVLNQIVLLMFLKPLFEEVSYWKINVHLIFLSAPIILLTPDIMIVDIGVWSLNCKERVKIFPWWKKIGKGMTVIARRMKNGAGAGGRSEAAENQAWPTTACILSFNSRLIAFLGKDIECPLLPCTYMFLDLWPIL
ncbi:unnamed protein product [Ilex paraguariensis]|uniref:Uncharacterized protein n=1 Tax=Ilex paraguariensis TaxID=185542 RepID=A0ABC8QZQ0_9AQUA